MAALSITDWIVIVVSLVTAGMALTAALRHPDGLNPIGILIALVILLSGGYLVFGGV